MNIFRNVILFYFALVLLPLATIGNTKKLLSNSVPSESLYIHTDKDIYFSGNWIFFKSYLYSNGQERNLLSSKIVYVTVFSTNGKRVSNIELNSNSPYSNGILSLPDTLKTGIYRVLAWTNNIIISNSMLFSKQILVVNRFDSNPMETFGSNLTKLTEILENSRELGNNSNGVYNDTIAESESFHAKATAPPGDAIPNEYGFSSSIVYLSTNKKTYGLREKVILKLKKSDISTSISSASVTVTRDESLLLNSSNILSYFGNQDHEEQYMANSEIFDPSIQQFVQVPLDYISTLPQYYSESQSEMIIIPENHGSILSGKVMDITTHKSISNAVVFLTTPDSVVNVKYSKTDTNGSFYFLLDDYYRGKSFSLNVFKDWKSGSNPVIEIREKYSPMPFSPCRIIIHSNIENYIDEGKIIHRVKKAYSKDQVPVSHDLYNPSFKIPLLYQNPLQIIKPSDYVQLNNLTEIVNEIIPVLRLRKQGSGYVSSMINARTRDFFDSEPIFFLNGTFVPDLASIAHLASDSIKRIELINLPWSLGDLEFNGIVALFTYKTSVNLSELGSQVVAQYPDYEKVDFISPDYDDDAQNVKNLPDLRDPLFWCPSIGIQNGNPSDLSFFTNDIAGNYSIVIEGFTTDRKPFRQRIALTVK